MADLNGFNANEVEPMNDFDPIPAGKYVVVITASQFKENKTKTGEYLELTFQVIEGEYKNRLLWARLCLVHPNPTTTKIARAHLADICKAVSVLTPMDSTELHNLPLVINVTVKRRTDNDELANEIKAYLPRESSTEPVTTNKPNVAPWRR